MTKGIIHYTDNRLEDPILSRVQETILASGLPIFSCSLNPMDFGQNIVFNGLRSYPTMVRQILAALEACTTDYVFFCEADVLYHKSHFDFTPPRDDVFFYNTNVWRWHYPEDLAITYKGLISLSGLCCNRELALNHYKLRLKKIEELEWSETREREPRWGRKMGYEPGTKKRRRGGLTDDSWEEFRSEYPIIDIRHDKMFTKRKTHLEDFKHKPANEDWKEIALKEIPGWDINKLFCL